MREREMRRKRNERWGRGKGRERKEGNLLYRSGR